MGVGGCTRAHVRARSVREGNRRPTSLCRFFLLPPSSGACAQSSCGIDQVRPHRLTRSQVAGIWMKISQPGRCLGASSELCTETVALWPCPQGSWEAKLFGVGENAT